VEGKREIPPPPEAAGKLSMAGRLSPTNPRYHPSYLGVVFDLDGTLADTRHDYHAMRLAVKNLAEKAGVPYGELHTTMTLPQMISYAEERLHQLGASEGIRLRLEADIDRALEALELKSLPSAVLVPGAKETLERLHRDGFRLGLLTRSSERYVQPLLHRLGIRDFFRSVRTRTDPGPAKPDPAALLALLKSMSVTTDRAVFVGDNALDLECAVGARVNFIGLVHPGHPTAARSEEDLRRRGAQELVHTFGELEVRIRGTA
jgi:HAD superfamily hydrolase (TIGR01549 family)